MEKKDLILILLLILIILQTLSRYVRFVVLDYGKEMGRWLCLEWKKNMFQDSWDDLINLIKIGKSWKN